MTEKIRVLLKCLPINPNTHYAQFHSVDAQRHFYFLFFTIWGNTRIQKKSCLFFIYFACNFVVSLLSSLTFALACCLFVCLCFYFIFMIIIFICFGF